MGKQLFIAEKPSVAAEFAKALGFSGGKKDGYMESETAVVTWCVGHLVTMSYPEAYDEKYKRWRLDTLPFLPDEFRYEVIPATKKQFTVVSGLLHRKDVDTIYVCTDSGREGEYIYRLVEQMAGVKGKERKRVWIDSQTEEEILRGIHEAKDLSAYDNLSDSAYLRAKEDYLMGINFSRLLTLKYGDSIAAYLHQSHTVIAVGRVMTCVLGMVVRREREIRSFVKTPFYRVLAKLRTDDGCIEAEWRAAEGSRYYGTPLLYKENGFKKEETARELIARLSEAQPKEALVTAVEKKKEKKYPPLLYNLAELQNQCSKSYRISPDQTLRIAQELYEKKLTTYPRTDARVLSSAVAKEITKNLNGLAKYEPARPFVLEIAKGDAYKNLARTRYVNDKQITDHYAIIPTGQGLSALGSLSSTARGVYDLIVRRFLGIFFPPALYQKVNVTALLRGESFFSGGKTLISEGYLTVLGGDPAKRGEERGDMRTFAHLKKGMHLPVEELAVREGETTPPKRYNSGSMILAMENAGQLIEDEELRAQIRGSGVGTSATRAEILKKLVNIHYLSLNKKTQIITPTQLGEMVFDVVDASIRPLLNAELTASWEKGLTYVAQGTITADEYMEKLEGFIRRRTDAVLSLNNRYALRQKFDAFAGCYKKAPSKRPAGKASAADNRTAKAPSK